MSDRVPAVGDNIQLWCCGRERIPYTPGQPLAGTITGLRASGYVDVSVTDSLGATQSLAALVLVPPDASAPDDAPYVTWA